MFIIVRFLSFCCRFFSHKVIGSGIWFYCPLHIYKKDPHWQFIIRIISIEVSFHFDPIAIGIFALVRAFLYSFTNDLMRMDGRGTGNFDKMHFSQWNKSSQFYNKSLCWFNGWKKNVDIVARRYWKFIWSFRTFDWRRA